MVTCFFGSVSSHLPVMELEMVAAASPVKTGHHIDYEVREPDSHRLVVAADVRRAGVSFEQGLLCNVEQACGAVFVIA